MVRVFVLVAAAASLAQGQTLASGKRCPTVERIVGALDRRDCGFACGTDRWSIKTLTDRDRDRIDFTVRPATVAALGRLRAPASRHPTRRNSVHERRVYCVEAFVIEARPQEDGDLHLSLIDAEDGRSEMIAEVPDPRCDGVCRSPYAAVFGRVRQHVEGKLPFRTDQA
jgi:hypothetical protein